MSAPPPQLHRTLDVAPSGAGVAGGATRRADCGGRHDTLVDRFREVLLQRPEECVYRFLPDGDGQPIALANAALDLRARAIAAAARERVGAGARVLIVCPPGLDYVASFFACLYAGLIAVPVYPPDPSLLKRTLPRLIAVIDDATPALILAPRSIAAQAADFATHAPTLERITWLAVDDIDDDAADSWRQPGVTGEDIAFLQYTSGSTSAPKGVMVSHGNLLHNLAAINRRAFDLDPADPGDAHMVTWLPPYHDMGLIGGLLAPAHDGYPVTFMSPFSFLKHPLRWLRAVCEHKATFSGGPNFAYELCATRISERERDELDLSSWRVAFSGAEPVRMHSIERFSQMFTAAGFRRRAFYPCYGLAEGTLAVTLGAPGSGPIPRRLEPAALGRHVAVDAPEGQDSRTVVGCGHALDGQKVLIVDPVTQVAAPERRIGEIWAAGPSVAQGYWQRPEQSAEVFGAFLADSGAGPFLRTGDLGFLDGAELFVTGRRKELVIIAGSNHYPHDIEQSVERADPALRPNCGVAGSREIDGEERLLVVYEVGGRPSDLAHIIAAIRARIAQEHGLQAYEVALVKRGVVPKTSSGKLQRGACLDALLDGSLPCLAKWSARTPTAQADDESPPVVTAAQIEQRLCRDLAERLGLAQNKVDPARPVAEYGLGSVDMVGIVGDLEEWLGRKLPATLLWEQPTIEALAEYLAAPSPSAAARQTRP
ncbi:AMP-binding protein [Actinocrinis puniceicyclus]|uniref:AMP-binding protein n=1 Tax=Actinocrinis puniceicyclus TaxID=977794 RepID=A0A8J7WNJ3_9ACTN|nr:AMP-binding protein [Actinocrinis puniceicyclus]MBS2962972.1 AMP-binding protein [Actinocrinis puniceicyclus]